MNCFEAQKRMNAYLEKRLSDEELTAFLDHVQHCDECMEELDLYLIIHQVLDENEPSTGAEPYTYRKSLQQKIQNSRREIRSKRLRRMATVLMVAIMFLAVLFAQYQEVFIQMHKDRQMRRHAAGEMSTEICTETAEEGLSEQSWQESETAESVLEEMNETGKTGSD